MTDDDDYVPSSSQDDYSSTDHLSSESCEDYAAEEGSDQHAQGEVASSYLPEHDQGDSSVEDEGLLLIPSQGDEYAGLEEQLALLFQLPSSPESHSVTITAMPAVPHRQQMARPVVSKKPVKMTDVGYRQSTAAMAINTATSKSASCYANDEDEDEYLDEQIHIGRRRRRRPGVRGRPRRKRPSSSGLLSGARPQVLPPAASSLMGAANEAYVKRDYARALEALREVIRWVPSLPTAYHLAGLCYDEQSETMSSSGQASLDAQEMLKSLHNQSIPANTNTIATNTNTAIAANNKASKGRQEETIKRQTLIEKAINYYLLAAHLDPANVDRWMRVYALLAKLSGVEYGGDPMGAYRQQAIYVLSRAIKSALSASAKAVSLCEGAARGHFSGPEEGEEDAGQSSNSKKILELAWERARLWAELQNPLRSIASFSYVLTRLAAITTDPGEAYEQVLRVAALGLTLPCVRQVTALMLTRCFPYNNLANIAAATINSGSSMLLSHRLVQLVLSMWTRKDVIDEVTHGLSTASMANGGTSATGTAWASPTAVDPKLRVVNFVESHVHLLASINCRDSILSYSSSLHPTDHGDAPEENSHRWFLLSDAERRKLSIAMLPNAIRIRYYLALGGEFAVAVRLLDDLLRVYYKHSSSSSSSSSNGSMRDEDFHYIHLLIQLVAEEHYQRQEYDKCLELLLSITSNNVNLDGDFRSEPERLVLSPASTPVIILAAECMLKTGVASSRVIAYLSPHLGTCRQAALLASDLYKQLGDTEGALGLLYQTNTGAANAAVVTLEGIFGTPLHTVDPTLLLMSTTTTTSSVNEDASDNYVAGTGILRLAYGFAPPSANRTTTRSIIDADGGAIARRRKRKRAAQEIHNNAAGRRRQRIELEKLALFAPFVCASPSSKGAAVLFDAMTAKKVDLLYTTRRIDEHLLIGVPLLSRLLHDHHEVLFPERPNEQQASGRTIIIGSASITQWSSLFLQVPSVRHGYLHFTFTCVLLLLYVDIDIDGPKVH